MLFRHKVLWSVLIIVFAALIFLILSLSVCAPESKPITLGAATVLPPPGISIVAAITSPAKESAEVKRAFDESYKIGKYQKLAGWVFIENQETKGQEAYVQLEKPDGTVAHYATMPVERPDVGIVFKNSLYNTSGFSALIPLKDGFDINLCKMRIVVKNKNGTYKSPIWEAGPKRLKVRT